ncbi:hypothetical protein [Amphritea sp. HPY]|uniref:hypothetical protein n=1 Tax=Amphritea sp. HPY TaxID=3421652 RepID=UPI003D7CCC9B
MDRSHVYIVPESDVEVQPHVYLGYIRKFGRVVFLLKRETYRQLKIAYDDLKENYKSDVKLTEKIVAALLSKHNMHEDETLFAMFAFMISTWGKGFKVSVERLGSEEVKLIVSK